MSRENQDKEKQLEQDEKLVKLIRVIARGIGPVLFIVMLVLAIGQGGIDRLIALNGSETIIFVGVISMFFGIFWAYQNEIAGGVLIVVAYIVICLVQGSLIPNAIYPIFLVTGLLYIYVGVMEISLKKRRR